MDSSPRPSTPAAALAESETALRDLRGGRGSTVLGFTRPVWMLGWVSFFTDVASETIYPLLPLFLTRVLGSSAMSLGVIEGMAEAANSGLKILSGWLADRWRASKLLVLAGYSLSSVARPLVGFATAWPQVLAIRFCDRLGKGIRGAPRDAMLAGFADPLVRGRVFGFQRAMDHAGAVFGPLIASVFLYFAPEDYRTLFALTLIPGVVVILIILRLPEPARAGDSSAARDAAALPGAATARAASNLANRALPRSFWRAMAVIFVFSLGNASDAFLLLRLSDLGFAAFWIPLLWSALHVVKVGSSLIGGALSDRFGRRAMIGLGWIVYAMVYAGFGAADSPAVVLGIFLSYGLYFGLTEGVEKAWVADMTPHASRGTAFGIYNAAVGIGALGASLLFGLIWTRVSPSAAFLTGAALALMAAVMLPFVPGRGRNESAPPRYNQRSDVEDSGHQ